MNAKLQIDFEYLARACTRQWTKPRHESNEMISQITVKLVQTSQSLVAHTTEICLSLDIFQRWFLARNRNPLVSTMSLYLHHFYLDEKSFLGPTLSLLQPQAKHPRLIFSLFKSFLFHRARLGIEPSFVIVQIYLMLILLISYDSNSSALTKITFYPAQHIFLLISLNQKPIE